MDITPLKQKFYHSCLITSLMMISKMNDQSIEERVFMEGEKRHHAYSLRGFLESFADNTMLSMEVIVDNKSFAEDISKPNNKNIKVRQEKITLALIKKILETQALIIHLDDNVLGDYSHASHFVVVEKLMPNGKFQVIDPMTGGRRILSEEKLQNSIDSLKSYIKMCPLIIRKI